MSKFLIAGLGNIGSDYHQTRHNIGFDVLDKLASELNTSFENQRYGAIAQGSLKGKTFILLKPATFMNLSGQAVRFWLQKEKLDAATQLLVVCDDLNLDFGVTRLKPNGSAGGHNGLKNIEELLESNKYPRLRVGIGNKFLQGQQVDFVLGKWGNEEQEKLPMLLQHCADAVKNFCLAGLEWTMNRYNKNALLPPPPKKEKPSEDIK